jgi:hypothetical protein
MACEHTPIDALMMIDFDDESGCALIVCSCIAYDPKLCLASIRANAKMEA